MLILIIAMLAVYIQLYCKGVQDDSQNKAGFCKVCSSQNCDVYISLHKGALQRDIPYPSLEIKPKNLGLLELKHIILGISDFKN